MIRLRIWAGEGPEYHIGVNETLIDMDHIDHCIDAMRQSFMCSADISPITWKWDEVSQSARGQLTTPHTCRDFEAIREWALEHQTEHFDIHIHAPDPLDDST
jgi:Mycotoxin biosynthesis protein UstYa